MNVSRGSVQYDQAPRSANLGFMRGGTMTRRKNSSRSRIDAMRASVSMVSPVRTGSSRSGGTGGGSAVVEEDAGAGDGGKASCSSVCSSVRSSDSGAYSAADVAAGAFGSSRRNDRAFMGCFAGRVGVVQIRKLEKLIISHTAVETERAISKKLQKMRHNHPYLYLHIHTHISPHGHHLPRSYLHVHGDTR